MADVNRVWDIRARDVPRDLFPNGRARFSLGTGDEEAVDRRRRDFDDLRAAGHWDIIRATSDGDISPAAVHRLLKKYGDMKGLQEIRSAIAATREDAVPTFADEAEDYLSWYAEPGRRSPKSVKVVAQRIRNLRREIGDLPMPELTTRDIERALDPEWAPATKHNHISAISGLMSWSARREREAARVEGRAPRWDRNPARDIDLPEKRGRRVTFTDRQVRDLIARAQLYQVAYIRTFAHCGLRLNELIHTRLHADLDLEAWRWKIQPRGPDSRCPCSQCKGPGWSPKTSTGERTFLVPAERVELRSAITDYLEAYPAEPGDFVFRNPRTGGVWGESTLIRDFQRLCDAAGVRYGRDVPGGVTLHSFRHTSITDKVRAGVRESVIAALHGDTIAEVMTYIHLDEDDLAKGLAEGPAYG